MRGKMTIAAAVPLAMVLGAVAIGVEGGPDPCAPGGGSPVRTDGEGSTLAVTHDDDVVLVDALGGRSSLRVRPDGVLRHPALGPGGLAYVEDLRGPDVLHLAGPSEVRIEGEGEITHPAWSPTGDLVWAEDLERLRLRSTYGDVADLGRPPGSEGVFSPVFVGDRAVAAIAIEPVDGYEGEDAALDNLWSLDLSTGAWTRLTSFVSRGDAWSILRTPVVMQDEAIRFVRTAGSADAGAPPASELWTAEPGKPASSLRRLPADALLAGRLGGELVLNVPDLETGTYRLLLETGRDLGCGTAMADPLIPLDPDRLDEEEGEDLSETAGVDEPVVSDGTLAIVVGDFQVRAEAVAVASGLSAAGEVRLLTHDEAPGAVAPDAWAVAIRVPEGVPVEEALASFRARFPQYEDMSWIAVP